MAVKGFVYEEGPEVLRLRGLRKSSQPLDNPKSKTKNLNSNVRQIPEQSEYPYFPRFRRKQKQ